MPIRFLSGFGLKSGSPTPLSTTPPLVLLPDYGFSLYYFTGIYVRTTADSLLKSTSTPDGVKAVTGRHAAKQPGHAQVYGEAADPCEALTSQRLQEALPRLQRVRIVFVDDSMRTVPADYTVKARMSVRCVSRLTGELGPGSKGAFAQAHNAATAP